MNSVVQTLYWCDVANKFSYLSGSIAFIFSVICIGTLAFIMLMHFAYDVKADAPFRTHSRKVAGITVICIGLAIVIAATVVVFLPSCSTRKVTVTAKIATALADRNLSQPERDYLQKLAASYSLKSEVARK